MFRVASTTIKQAQVLSLSCFSACSARSGLRDLSYGSISNFNAVSHPNSRLSKLSLTNATNRISCRFLYTEDALGIDARSIANRERHLEPFMSQKDRYVQRLKDSLNGENMDSFIYSDLTYLIKLADNDEHFDLIEKVAARLKDAGKLMKRGWGSSVARRYYGFSQIDRAYKNIMDTETYGDFFNEYTCYKVIMSCLFEEGKYREVIDLYYTASKQLVHQQDNRVVESFPKLAFIAFGALAKINTLEALEEAERMFVNIIYSEMDYYIQSRIITFMAYLAINQDQPIKALNYLHIPENMRYSTLRELKSIAWIKLKYYKDLLAHLQHQSKDEQKQAISANVCKMIEDSRGEIEDINVCQELLDLLSNLKKSNQVGEFDLESMVFHRTSEKRAKLDIELSELRQRLLSEKLRGSQRSRDSERSRNSNGDSRGFQRPNNRDRQKKSSYFEEDELELFDEPQDTNIKRFR